MAFSSMRDFIAALDGAGELIRIAEPVRTELEITALADRQMKAPGGGKALLFEKTAAALGKNLRLPRPHQRHGLRKAHGPGPAGKARR